MMHSPSFADIFACNRSDIEEPLRQAANLVNPASGIANDYLNQYNEILLLVENLPVLLPEMVEELLAWKPKTYREYFETSPLPRGDVAIKIYQSLNPSFRNLFEAHVQSINAYANTAISVIGDQQNRSQELSQEYIEAFCAEISKILRIELEKANDFVNHGLALPVESPQQMADRLMQN
ncbi:MAG: hypothetical protein WAN43_20445 [Rhodomicrobium sp.]|jgi:hypothetical protein